MTDTWDVIVVGGGMAGLAAGATAARAGASTLVLDGHEPGGRARVTERNGFVFNMGAHALYVKGPGWRVLEALGVSPAGVAPPLRRYRVRFRGQSHVMPASAASLMKTTALSPRSKAQLLRLLAALPMIKPEKLAGQSVAEWIEARELRPDAAAVVGALVRIGTYSNDHGSFGADAAVAQLQAAARRGVLYLHGGWSQLIGGLAARVEVRSSAGVETVEPAAGRVEVASAAGTFVASSVVVAAGTPAATAGLLPGRPGWGDLGDPVTAACLDVACRRVPSPGWMLGVDEPLYATTQSPPARQAPAGCAVVGVLRYGARSAAEDRPDLEAYLGHAGVRAEDILFDRFLARMVVAGSAPLAVRGGFGGRPGVGASGADNVFIAGDWVGPEGLLADAALASGHAAGLAAARRAAARSTTMVA